jgi:hypothetical protein
MKTKMFCTVLGLALTASLSARAEKEKSNVFDSPSMSPFGMTLAGPGLSTMGIQYSSASVAPVTGELSGEARRFKDIAVIAADDIARYKATGEVTEYLEMTVQKISQVTKRSPDEVIAYLIADKKANKPVEADSNNK